LSSCATGGCSRRAQLHGVSYGQVLVVQMIQHGMSPTGLLKPQKEDPTNNCLKFLCFLRGHKDQISTKGLAYRMGSITTEVRLTSIPVLTLQQRFPNLGPQPEIVSRGSYDGLRSPKIIQQTRWPKSVQIFPNVSSMLQI
jgi:hypothetical protein